MVAGGVEREIARRRVGEWWRGGVEREREQGGGWGSGGGEREGGERAWRRVEEGEGGREKQREREQG